MCECDSKIGTGYNRRTWRFFFLDSFLQTKPDILENPCHQWEDWKEERQMEWEKKMPMEWKKERKRLSQKGYLSIREEKKFGCLVEVEIHSAGLATFGLWRRWWFKVLIIFIVTIDCHRTMVVQSLCHQMHCQWIATSSRLLDLGSFILEPYLDLWFIQFQFSCQVLSTFFI